MDHAQQQQLLATFLQRRVSRRGLVKTFGAAGAVGALGVVGFGATAAPTSLLAGGASHGLGARLFQSAAAEAAAPTENLQDILNIIVTTEMFGVTVLGAALASNAAGNFTPAFPDVVIEVLTAARAQEMAHLQFFRSLGGQPLTDTFHVPDPALLTDTVAFFDAVQQQETREIAAQIAAIGAFTAQGRPDLVKVSFQYGAEEGEHRLLANFAKGSRPANDHAFSPKFYDTEQEFLADFKRIGIIDGSGPAAQFPGPGTIDPTGVVWTTPDGPLVACTPPSAVSNGATVLTATLTGAEAPGPGDSAGLGFAKVTLSPSSGVVCFRLSVANIAPATAAHIHVGGAGVAGPIVVPFSAPGDDGLANGCVQANPSLVQAIVDNPAGYYVNVHNESYPAGALRGQLQPL